MNLTKLEEPNCFISLHKASLSEANYEIAVIIINQFIQIWERIRYSYGCNEMNNIYYLNTKQEMFTM